MVWKHPAYYGYCRSVFIRRPQDKWDKTKSQIEEIIRMVETDPNHLVHKRLEQVQGFLQDVTQTYSGMTPYIIGFHLMIDGWRDDCSTT